MRNENDRRRWALRRDRGWYIQGFVDQLKSHYKEVAEVFGKLEGHEVRYEQIPWEDFVKATKDIATDYVVWNHRVGYQVNVDELREEFPWLQTLEEYLQAT